MNKIEKITNKQLNPTVPEFRVGDTVNVGVRIIEGNKERNWLYYFLWFSSQ